MSVKFLEYLVIFSMFFCFGGAIIDALQQHWLACFVMIICCMININTFYSIQGYWQLLKEVKHE